MIAVLGTIAISCGLYVASPPAVPAMPDSIRTADANCITVYADGCTCPTNTIATPTTRSIDQLMQHATAAMTRRAALASEPSIRGLNINQIALSIDGMKIHAACVDHMDPPTAYMELANLEKLDVQRGAEDMRYGANLGAAVAFTLRTPDVTVPFAADAALSAESNGWIRNAMAVVSGSTNTHAGQISVSYRKADNYRAGSNVLVEGSEYEKVNVAARVVGTINDRHVIYGDVIYDRANFMGFPALLMDTRRADGLIGAVTWKGTYSNWTSSVKLYSNRVDHQMDDYSRPLSQIQSRAFMPNMYMPMVGRSSTTGILAEARIGVGQGFLYGVLDCSLLHARADMTMFPTDTTIRTMRLINIGDAQVNTNGLLVGYDVSLTDDISTQTNIRVEVSPRALQDPTARSVLSGYVPDAQFYRTLVGTSASAALTVRTSDYTTSRLILSTSQRMPTHLEQYGFWIYDPQSNFVTIGNPNLKPERSWQSELTSTYTSENVRLIAAAYVQIIDQYIAPSPPAARTEAPMERTYGNVGTALLMGVEATADIRIHELAFAGVVLGYTRGRFTSLADNVPMIPPFFSRIRAVVGTEELNAEVATSVAARQSLISTTVRPENATAAWTTTDVTCLWKVNAHVAASIGIVNVFDTLYHEHLSINDLLSPGRSLRVSIRTTW